MCCYLLMVHYFMRCFKIFYFEHIFSGTFSGLILPVSDTVSGIFFFQVPQEYPFFRITFYVHFLASLFPYQGDSINSSPKSTYRQDLDYKFSESTNLSPLSPGIQAETDSISCDLSMPIGIPPHLPNFLSLRRHLLRILVLGGSLCHFFML